MDTLRIGLKGQGTSLRRTSPSDEIALDSLRSYHIDYFLIECSVSSAQFRQMALKSRSNFAK
jgi:hypothetical protein